MKGLYNVVQAALDRALSEFSNFRKTLINREIRQSKKKKLMMRKSCKPFSTSLVTRLKTKTENVTESVTEKCYGKCYGYLEKVFRISFNLGSKTKISSSKQRPENVVEDQLKLCQIRVFFL